MSADTLLRLSALLEVNPADLVPDSAPRTRRRPLVLDLDVLRRLPLSQGSAALHLADAVLQQRGGRQAGHVASMALRHSDLAILAAVYDLTPAEMAVRMDTWVATPS